MHVDAHVLEIATSVPFIILLTQYLKQFVSNRHRLLIPLLLGPLLVYAGHLVGSVNPADILESLLRALAMPDDHTIGSVLEGLQAGAAAALTVKYGTDNADVIKKVIEKVNGNKGGAT